MDDEKQHIALADACESVGIKTRIKDNYAVVCPNCGHQQVCAVGSFCSLCDEPTVALQTDLVLPAHELLAALVEKLLDSDVAMYHNRVTYNDAYLGSVGRPDLFEAKYHSGLMRQQDTYAGAMECIGDGWSNVSQEEADIKAAIAAAGKCADSGHIGPKQGRRS